MSIGNTLELIQRSKPLTRHAVKRSVLRPVSETLREKISVKAGSGTNLERSLPQDRRMLRQCWLQQESATIARYSLFRNCLQEHSAALARKFLLNQLMQMLSDRWMIETLDDFVQKAGD
jgi:hypothetical protein